MPWYSIVDPSMERWLTLGVFVACFALILHRRVRIVYIALGGATLLILLGIVNPADAVLRMVDWNVLAIYWGYGVLAILLGESGLPAKVASWVLARIGTEKYALLLLCALAAFLSSFMANPVVVIMLVPLAIEMAERLRGSLFVYLVSLAISSNVVTTVTMVADPPALILAMATGLEFLDFYWFKSRPGLGTLSIVGVIVALLTLLWQFRHLNGRVALREERIDVDYTPMGLLVVSVAFLAFVPMEHPGLVGNRGEYHTGRRDGQRHRVRNTREASLPDRSASLHADQRPVQRRGGARDSHSDPTLLALSAPTRAAHGWAVTPHESQWIYTFNGRASLGGLITGAVPSLAMVTPAGFSESWAFS